MAAFSNARAAVALTSFSGPPSTSTGPRSVDTKASSGWASTAAAKKRGTKMVALARWWVKVTWLEEMAPLALTWTCAVTAPSVPRAAGATTVSSVSEAARMRAGWVPK